MKAYIFLSSFVISILTLTLIVPTFAQDDVPSYNPAPGTPEDNACFPGGIWGDGRCEHPDEAVQNWYWTCGWYVARYDAGVYGLEDIPDTCRVLLIGEIVEVADNVAVVATCNGLIMIDMTTLGVTNYDATADGYATLADLNGCIGLEIHGTAGDDTITGSPGNDTVYGYAGNDNISGGDGDDTLYGGDKSCNNGGTGNCTGAGLGDTLNGGEGDDILNGGDESCTGDFCNEGVGSMGDTLNGDPGNDTLNGGNESCNGTNCNADGSVGDTLNGDTGNDTLYGGDESFTGTRCNQGATRSEDTCQNVEPDETCVP